MESIRRIRTMRGMNQVELAKASGVAQNTISEIETGRREARPATLRKLADALDAEIADFFEEPTYPKEVAPPDPQRSFNGLLEEERREALIRSCVEYALSRAERWNVWLAQGDRELLGEMVVEYDSLAPFLVNGVLQAALGSAETALGTEVMRAMHRLNHTMEHALESLERIDAESAQRARTLLERWSA